MADDKLNTDPEENKFPEAPAPVGPGDAPTPEHMEQAKSPAASEKVIDLEGVRTADDKGDKAPWEKSLAEIEAVNPPKRRGRAPKEQARPESGKTQKTAEPRTGRPPKTGEATRDEASSPKRKAAPVKEAAAPVPKINLPPTPAEPPRPIEKGKIVYLKLSELHPFHTFRKQPFKVVDDAKIMELVVTIK